MSIGTPLYGHTHQWRYYIILLRVQESTAHKVGPIFSRHLDAHANLDGFSFFPPPRRRRRFVLLSFRFALSYARVVRIYYILTPVRTSYVNAR